MRRAGLVIALGAAAAISGCQSGHPPKGPLIQAPAACADFAISIYFEADSAAITRQAHALIDSAAERTRGCGVSAIHVVGLSSAAGDPAANLALSSRRANAVTEALARRGFKGVDFQVAAAGATGAENMAGQARPVRRRVDVAFHLASRR